MSTQKAETIVEKASPDWDMSRLPQSVIEIADRQRAHLVSLAASLLAMEKEEAEVVELIERAVQGFNRALAKQVEDNEHGQ
jgi:hypothetical protein